MKTIAVTILALMLFSSLAYANGVTAADDPVDEETIGQVKAMGSSLGATMRMLQLEKSIDRNILFGEKLIERIEANDSSFDASVLESLLEELRLLKAEVADVAPEGETNEVVKQFIDLKSDAREIVKEFRTIVHESVDASEIGSLKAQIGNEVDSQMNQTRERVKESIRNHNAEVVRKKLQTMNKTNAQLVQRLTNGEATASQVKSEVRNMIQQMSSGEKSEAVMAMKREMTSVSVRTQSAAQAAEDGYQDRLETRLRERLQSMPEQNGTMLQQRIETVVSAQAESGSGTSPAGPGTTVTGQAFRGGAES